MANALPQINVTDPRTAEGQSADACPGLPSFVEGNGVTKDSRAKAGNSTERELIRSRQSHPILGLRLQCTCTCTGLRLLT